MKKLNKKSLLLIGVVGLVVLVTAIFGITKLVGSSTNYKGYTNKKPSQNNNPQEEVPAKVQVVDLESPTRPIAVMINNASPARSHHSSLQEAYLVYEIMVEGGITRYMALYKDKTPEQVGSVRSARINYLDYALENDAIYIHWGGNKLAIADIPKLGVDDIDAEYYGDEYFYRKYTNELDWEHTGHANLKNIKTLANNRFRSETNKDLLLNYSATNINPNVASKTANKVDLTYSDINTTNYVYDVASNTYKQSVNDRAHTDYLTKKQYTVKNIIAYQVVSNTLSGGVQSLENTGNGTGYFITGGKSYEITWQKDTRSSQTIYRYKETGEEITVNDGNTWIHVMPTSGNISITE